MALRLGFILCLSILSTLLRDQGITAAGPPVDPDPDERFVTASGQPVGTLSLEVIEGRSGIHLPSRLYFAHADGRSEPPTVGRFQNFLVTASGREVKTLPVGEYDVYISRGTEYTLDHQRVQIERDKTTYLTSTLERAIDTAGFISSDFHLHLMFAMRDGAMVTAAEGIDLLTATDHNILKDYEPYIRELKIERFMKSAVGIEVDTSFGHFNSFPVGLNSWDDITYRKAIRTPGELLRLLRQNPGDEITQINHPRGRNESNPTTSYFDGRLNRETTEIEYPYFEAGFDQVEIFNALADSPRVGDNSPDRIGRIPLVDQKLKDWYSLLNRGLLIAGVGNTDSHLYPKDLPGYPRNYVASETDNPWEIDPAKVVNALKNRASTASLGPFIEFTANGARVGSIITDLDRSVNLSVKVQAAPWIPVDKIEIVSNGKVIDTFPVTDVNPKERVRFAKEVIRKPTSDAWYLVLATSERPWQKPFEKFSSFSFTNPIFVDVDGNGYFDPPNGGYQYKPKDD
ncbi:MAG: CehA/McbA family metallohydrolase [Bryobacteraceae bacterium]